MTTPSMLPIFLADLEEAGAAQVQDDRVVFVVPTAWCAPGERRVGYTGIVRLIECVRELHWRRDVLAGHPGIDSITQALALEFFRPVAAGATVVGRYVIAHAGTTSYTLDIMLLRGDADEELARARVVSVFYDDMAAEAVAPPAGLQSWLAERAQLNGAEPN